MLYADPSAIVRAYFADEPDHEILRTMLLEAGEAVCSSEIALLELTSAFHAAGRAHRGVDVDGLSMRLEADCAEGGAIALVPLRPDVVFPVARRLLADHALRTLDSIHLAVALQEVRALTDDGLVFMTRDDRQARAARVVGLEVR